jgi:hypothetical protein
MGVGPNSSQAWTSLAWTEADPAPFSGPGNQFIMGGAAWNGGLVLVGEDFDLPSETSDGAVWSSKDGLHWQLIPNTDGTFSGSEISAVAARGSSLVAVGDSRPENQAQGTLPSGLSWTSSDGINWRRETGPGSVMGQISPGGVVAGPSGFVVYGSDLSTSAQAILYSSDGVAWQRVVDTGGVFSGARVVSVTTTGGGFAAVGYGTSHEASPTAGGLDPTPGPAAAWWSTDGRTWHGSDVGPGGYAFGSVQPWVGGTLRALGSGGCGGCIGPPVAWYSSDGGRTWRQDPRASVSVTYDWSLAIGDRELDMDQTLVATESADGRSWDPLPMTGATLTRHTYLQIARGQTVIVTATINPPAGLPNDQADSRVYVGTLQ